MLYEPTNIIPSTMTQTGTVAATTDNVNIQWQVNGNSAMTMFQIDIMKNNADSTPVYSTGAVTENPTVAQGYSLPFYGKDRFGDYVQFVYQPNQTWSAWSRSAILDGNSYKFRITQFFQENGTACKLPITSNLSAGTTYYFSYSVNGTTQYVSFTVVNASYFVSENTIYFNFSHSAGWVVTSGNNSRAITDITFSVSETQPSGTELSGAEAVSSGDTFYNQFFTAQNSASSFITRTKPLLTITPLAETPVASATQNFTATYSQAQGDSINTVRWRLYNADDMSTPIDDTGEISTSVLSYEYNGLFDGQSYSVICIVTTENGVSVSATLNFSVQYEQGTYTGDFTAQSLCHEDANLLKWGGLSAIPGVDEPSGSATISDGQLILPIDSSVTWSQKTDESGELQPMNFQSPWTAIWNGKILPTTFNLIQTAKTIDKLSGMQYSSFFSTDGKFYITISSGGCFIYFVEQGVMQYVGSPKINGATVSPVFNGCINNSVTLFILCSNNGIHVFSINGNDFIYLYDLDGTELHGGTVGAISFSPNGDILVVCDTYNSPTRCHVFSVSGNQISYLYDVAWGLTGSSYSTSISFNSDGTMMVIGGTFDGHAALFSVDGNNIVFLRYITNNGTPLTASVMSEFAHSENMLILSSTNSSETFTYAYDVNGTTVSYISDLHNGTGESVGGDIFFNENDSFCIIGSSVFSVNETAFTYLFDLENPISALSTENIIVDDEFNYYSVVWQTTPTISMIGEIGIDGQSIVSSTLYAINNAGTMLCVSNYYNDTFYLYAIIENNLVFLRSIKMELDGISSMSFNQDGTILAVGGGQRGLGYARLYVYKVDGLSVSFLSNLSSYINSTGEIRAIAFSSDNSLLVAGLFNGAYSGGTYVFANDNGSVSYLFELEKDGSGFYYAVNDIAFSPDGKWLVVGGGSKTSFYPTYYGTDYVNIFRVTYGTNPTIEFTQTINLNAGVGISAPDALCYTVSFSPDGALLLLGGTFEGHAKTYSFDSENTISPAQFVSDITINNQSLDVFDPEYTDVISVLSFNSEGTSLLARFINSNSTILFSVNDTNVLYTATIHEGESSWVYRGGYIPNSTLYFMGNELWEQNSPVIEKIFAVFGDGIFVSQNGQQITVSRVLENNTNETIGTTLIIEKENVATNNIVIALMPTSLQVYSFLDGQYIGMQEISISYTQQRISSAQLQGKQTCNYFTIIDGDGSNIAENLTDYTWEPEWDNENYTVDLLANFNYGIDGGTATQAGTGFRIYRRKTDGTENIELATLPSTTLSLRDYGIKSNESYIYDFYVYDANGAFMGVRSTETTPLKRQFKRFSLLSTQYNESDGCYHVVKEYQFSCNIQDMAVSNNSNKSYVQNFTPYPTVFQSTANYASGTLQALIGFVDPKAYKYWDSTQLMDELNALSTTTNTLFLKDMKGHLWMVDVGTVQMTATQKTREMQVTISLPWTEIGAASDVSIIQTPDDEGWDYGEQVLDVKLDVDVNTGLLYVTYPFPYNGTAFYLVGTNPVGSENIVQPLPETASSPQDGILKAKVRDK